MNRFKELLAKRGIIFFTIILYVFTIIEIIIIYLINIDTSLIEILKFQLVFIYIWNLILSKILFKWSNLYTLFLLTFGLFLLSRIFLDILGLYQFEWANKFRDFYFSLKTQRELLIYLTVALIGLQCGAMLAMSDPFFHKKKIKEDLNSLPLLKNISIKLFILSLPGTLIKYWIQIKTVISQGYLSVYDGTIKNLQYPLFVNESDYLLEFSFCLFIASKPSKKDFFRISIIFLTLKLLDSLKGERNRLFLPIFFLVWFFYNFYTEKDLKLRYGIGGGVLLIAIAQWFLIFRHPGIDFFNDYNPIVLFFAQQGVSILVLGYMINYKMTFVAPVLPFILFRFQIFQNIKAQDVSYLNKTLGLGHHLTYFLSPQAYQAGEGIGNSFLGELYDLSFLGYVLGSVIIGYLIIKFHSLVKKNRILLLLSYYIVPTIIFMPRGSTFPPIRKSLILIAIFFIILELIKIIPKKIKENE